MMSWKTDIATIDDEVYSNDNDPERWDVQIFRSIDSNSVKGFPKDPREATSKVTEMHYITVKLTTYVVPPFIFTK